MSDPEATLRKLVPQTVDECTRYMERVLLRRDRVAAKRIELTECLLRQGPVLVGTAPSADETRAELVEVRLELEALSRRLFWLRRLRHFLRAERLAALAARVA